MRAIVYTKYGGPDVLGLADIAEPVAGPEDVTIRVEAVHFSRGDNIARKGMSPWPLMRVPARLMMGLLRPRSRVLGGEFAGEVIAVGKDVSRFAVGDKIMGFTDMRFGAFAEILCLPQTALVARRPEGVSAIAAAAVGTVLAKTALHFVRQTGVGPGKRVLINGASGGLGRPAVQLAKHLGAHVTGVCRKSKMDLVRTLGADAVHDYAQGDIAKSGQRFDIVLDMAGRAPFSRFEKCLNPGGTFASSMFTLGHIARATFARPGEGKRVLCLLGPQTVALLEEIGDLLAKGVLEPVIDRTIGLEQVPEASALLDRGEEQGSIVVCPNGVPSNLIEARQSGDKEKAQ